MHNVEVEGLDVNTYRIARVYLNIVVNYYLVAFVAAR